MASADRGPVAGADFYLLEQLLATFRDERSDAHAQVAADLALVPADHHGLSSRHDVRERAVIRTVGSARDPVRYLSVNRPQSPRIAHARQARPAGTTTCRYQLSPVFPRLRRRLRRFQPNLANDRIRPTHSPRTTADGLMNRSLSRRKPVTQSSVTVSELLKLVAGPGFEPG
jgi:hypothetical protein